MFATLFFLSFELSLYTENIPENMPYHCVAYSFGRQNGRLVTTFGSILRHILGFSAYFMFGIGFAHILSVERF